MKRMTSPVTGRSMQDKTLKTSGGNMLRDVAGLSGQSSVLDVASFRDAFSHDLDDPMGTAESDSELMADFADFMSGGSESEHAELPPPAPLFREQLRRRLWRTLVLAHLRDGGGGETH